MDRKWHGADEVQIMHTLTDSISTRRVHYTSRGKFIYIGLLGINSNMSQDIPRLY